MDTLQVIFYKGPGGMFSKAIRLISRGPYSHVELRFPDGQAVRSSEKDGGVRWKELPKTASHWDTIHVPVKSVSKIRDWCQGQLGCKYDWKGILQFIWPQVRQNPKRWYCSEFVHRALTADDTIKLDSVIRSPNRLYKLLTKET